MFIAWSADAQFFAFGADQRLAATISAVRVELIGGTCTFSLVD
ncbi:hypothetical protein [Mycobacterium leprae]|nr:hypothetical protein [Mycobacterium leprae]